MSVLVVTDPDVAAMALTVVLAPFFPGNMARPRATPVVVPALPVIPAARPTAMPLLPRAVRSGAPTVMLPPLMRMLLAMARAMLWQTLELEH